MKRNKISAGIVAFMLVSMSALPINSLPFANAYEISDNYVTGKTDNGFSYIIDEDNKDTVTLINYSGKESSPEIPEEICGISKIIIGRDTFSNKKSIQNIIIPDNVIEIEAHTFYCCKELETIIISDSVKSIGASAFAGCFNLKNVKLPSNLKKIESTTFHECTSLESIDIPDSVSVIGNGSFSLCEQLSEINFSKNITAIESGAFNRCTSLKEVELPSGITVLEPFTFAYCQNLKSLSIPYGVETIKSGAFQGASGITSLIIPESVKFVGKYAFSLYPESSETTIYSRDIEIEEDAFLWDTSYKSTFVIKSYSGSEAEKYAEENQYTFEAIPEEIKGDINSDGTISSSDYILLSMYLTNNNSSEINYQNSDINSDNKINVFDLIRLKSLILS